ncbi:alpha carbonic anhydrase 1, chloroplastic-like [Zingiber officinale]|uniref:alpha carbonic anhydrase 1, chloroplastic-like n=1 Tax=Zingiber officinale TaxID=94328 RepID=UPI001C4D348C|nr:alpha carbonic anhydrase 1, chloroplastic-like [Zingiber officinale]
MLVFSDDDSKGFVRYGYSGVNGPDKWGSLSSDFSLCSQGKKQSPINIAKNITSNDPDLKPADRNYNKTRATIINNGLNIELVYEKGPGIMAVDGKNYTLEKMVWHLPAEHTLDGESFPMELQLIHKSADNNITVVAILYQYGSNDAFLLQVD